jgi:hypothetical protein
MNQNEVFLSRYFENLQVVSVAFFADGVPVYANVLRIHDGRNNEIRGF